MHRTATILRAIFRADSRRRGRHGRYRRGIGLGSVVALVAGLVTATTVATVAASSPAVADPGDPGNPGDPAVLYSEDFENGVGTDPVSLTDYTGAPPANETYTADPVWLVSCNGAVVEYNAPDSAVSGTALNNCEPNPNGGNPANFFDRLRQLSWVLGSFAAVEPATNHAVTAYTANDPGADNVEFATQNPISLPSATGRFVTFSVDTAAVNCFVSAPAYNFSIVSGATTTPVGGTVDACAGGQTIQAPAVGGTPAGDIHVGTYTSNGSVLITGSSLGLRMTNANGSGVGNDAAFDNIKILDVTPQLDKSFSPTTVEVGDISTLTLTVTNTSELAAKDGWGFTDTLPDHLVVAPTPNLGGTCDATTDATAGGSAIAVTDGNLDAGEASCTITVDVTSDTAGTYTNGPDNIDEVVGIDPPGDATVTFKDGPAWTCNAYGYLFQTPGPGQPQEGQHLIQFIDLATGEVADTETTSDGVNAVGYNPKDNYFYAWSGLHPVKIGSDGSLMALPVPTGMPQTNAVIGDFDSDGHYWTVGQGRIYYEIDYSDPASPTYGQLLDSGYMGDLPTNISRLSLDWVWINGSLYSTGENPAGNWVLIQYHLNGANSSIENLGTWVGPDGPIVSNGANLGAMYADPAGNLYVSNNESGEIYRINTTTRQTINVATGPASLNNDGARCASAPIPTITVTKTVESRVSPQDQFTVGLENAAGEVLTSATTSGTDTAASTTDWPVSPNAQYTITDTTTAVSPNTIGAYDATVECRTVGGDPVDVAGSGPWTVTSSDTDAITCDVTNSAKPALQITKTSNATDATRMGDTVHYIVRAMNVGGADFTADHPAEVIDDLTGVLDDASFDGTVTVTGSDVEATYSEPQIKWAGPLASGDSVTLEYDVVLNKSGDQDVENVAFQPPPCDSGTCPPPTPPTREDCASNNGYDPATDLPCDGTNFLLPKLTVEKSSDDLATAEIGDTVRYSITATNTGKADYTADGPAEMVDDLGGVLDDASYNSDAAVTDVPDAGPGTLSYLEPQISWTGALAVGDSVTVIYSVTLTGNGDTQVDNVVFETPPCATGDCPQPPPPNPGDCAANNNIDPATGLSCDGISGGLPKLDITKAAPDLVDARIGDTVTWTVTATNIGTRDYTSDAMAVVVDDLTGVLDDVTFDGAVTTKGSTIDAIYSAPQIGWAGPLAQGETVTITYSGVLTGAGDGRVDNVAWQVPPGPTPECDLGSCPPPDPADCTETGVNSDTGLPCVDVNQPLPRPEVTKTATPENPHVGDTVTYTVTFTNTGPGDYTASRPAQVADDLSGVLDDATFDGTVTTEGSDNDAVYADSQIVWTGPLAAGDTVTLTYQVTFTGAGDLQATNVAYVPPPPPLCDASDGADCPPPPTPTPPDPGDCTGGVDTTTGLPCVPVTEELPKLEITKTSPELAQAHIGDRVTYTVTATSVGARDFTADDPALVIDDLTGVLDDATFDGAVTVGGSKVKANYDEPRITWTGPLAVGDTITLTYTVHLTGAGDLQVTNVAFVPPLPPTDCGDDCPPYQPPTPKAPDCAANNNVDPATGLPCVPVTQDLRQLQIVKSSDAAGIVHNGDTVTYTVTATNVGPGDYTADLPATVVDDLTGALDDATYNDDATADVDGQLAYVKGQLSWVGALATGTSVTIRYTVTVTGQGDLDLVNVAFTPPPLDADCASTGTCPTPDPKDCVGGVDSVTGQPCAVTEMPLPGLYVTKAVDKTNVEAADTLTFTVTMTNTGNVDFTTSDPAVLTDDLSGVLDDAAYSGDAAADAEGDLGYADQVLTWSGALAMGATVTVTYTVTINAQKTGDDRLNNVASIPGGITPRYPNGECPDGTATCDPPAPQAITVSAVTRSGGGTLPNTGNDTAGQLQFAALLLLFGLGLALAGRRRRHRTVSSTG